MKKGFTLVELLGVIVIMAIIMLMGSVGVSSLKKGINESMWNSNVKLILEGAKRYGEDNKSYIIKNNCSDKKKCINVSLEQLLSNGYVSSKDYYKDGEVKKKTIINPTIDKQDTVDANLTSGYYANNMNIKIWIENNIVYAEVIAK